MSYHEIVDMIPDPEPVQESRIDEIYSTPDDPAEYPGGNKEMLSFLSKNIKYPAEAAELGIEGKCFLSFTVELDGSLTNIKVVRGVRDCPACDKEAIRVVKLMPKWKPGKLNGQTVRSTFTLPIRFMLQ